MSVIQSPEQFLEQLPSAAVVRDKIQRHREEGKVLRRLLKLASEHESATRSLNQDQGSANA